MDTLTILKCIITTVMSLAHGRQCVYQEVFSMKQVRMETASNATVI